MNNNNRLSKSSFLKGIKCGKATYLHYNEPNESTNESPELLSRFRNGRKVGQIGRDWYEGGIDLSQEGKLFGVALIEPTKQALKNGERILYEAAFVADGNLIKYFNTPLFFGKLLFVADIVVITEKEIKIFEIKSSTELKLPFHIYDIGFQMLVLRNSEILKQFDLENKKIELYILHVNKDYVRSEKLETNKLFVEHRVTNKAINVEPLVLEYIAQINETLSSSKSPNGKKGKKCFSPFPCEFVNRCWKTKLDDSILSIGNLPNYKAKTLLKNKISKINQINKGVELTGEQWTEVHAKTQGKIQVDKKELAIHLKGIMSTDPIYFLNFDSYSTGIPKFKNTSPYQHIYFQYSILFRENPDSELILKEFISEPGIDPRRRFIENFLNDTQGSAKIIIYDQAYRKNKKSKITYGRQNILNQMHDEFPEYKEALDDRIKRIVNIGIAFESRSYYDSRQAGSDKQDVILKLLAPELDFSQIPYGNEIIAKCNYEDYESLSLKDQILTKRSLPIYSRYKSIGLQIIVDTLLAKISE